MITKAFPVGALPSLASCTPSLSVVVLFFPGSVVVVCCSGVKSVVEVSLAKSPDRVVVSGVLVDIFVKGVVVVSFCFIYNVVALLVVLKFVPAVVVTCEDIVVVRRVALLFVVEALVEVVVTAVYKEEDVQSILITNTDCMAIHLFKCWLCEVMAQFFHTKDAEKWPKKLRFGEWQRSPKRNNKAYNIRLWKRQHPYSINKKFIVEIW